MPAYANMTHNSFVCTKCSGIHREFQFKIKGISMSIFTQEEVSALEAGGNSLVNATYLARYQNGRDVAIPTTSTDNVKLREFIKQKYLDKKWFGDSSTPNSSFNDNSSRRSSTTDINKVSINLPKV